MSENKYQILALFLIGIVLILLGVYVAIDNQSQINQEPKQEFCQKGYLIYSYYNETTKTGDTYVSDIPIYQKCKT